VKTVSLSKPTGCRFTTSINLDQPRSTAEFFNGIDPKRTSHCARRS
jgi:hypothetical protein